jgi:uncharacterized membrane protein
MQYNTSIRLPENIVAALSYTVGWVSGIFFLLLERNNKFVRFHAMQSVLIFMPIVLLLFLVGWVPYIGWLIADEVGMAAMLILLILMYMAYRGSKFKIPIIGKIAYEYAYGNKD